MRLSGRAKRMIVHQERNRAGVSLNLIPMIDILSVMVSFLLVYSTEVEVLQNSKGIEIPESVAEQKPRETVVIMITRDELLVQGQAIARIADIEKMDGTIIAPLKSALERPTVAMAQIAERLRNTYEAGPSHYDNAGQLLADIDLVAGSLLANRGRYAGYHAVRRLQHRVRTFGFHLATLDVRQHRDVHHEVLAQGLGDEQWFARSDEERLARLRLALEKDQGPVESLDAVGRRTLWVFEAVMVSRSSGWKLMRLSARSASTPPTVARGMVSTTSRLSFTDRNIAAMMRNRTSTAKAKFCPMLVIALLRLSALPP